MLMIINATTQNKTRSISWKILTLQARTRCSGSDKEIMTTIGTNVLMIAMFSKQRCYKYTQALFHFNKSTNQMPVIGNTAVAFLGKE